VKIRAIITAEWSVDADDLERYGNGAADVHEAAAEIQHDYDTGRTGAQNLLAIARAVSVRVVGVEGAEPRLRRCEVWAGTYRGVSFEIRRADFAGRPGWAHYIYLHEPAVPVDLAGKIYLPRSGNGFDRYDYSGSMLAGLTWHGGISYYEYTSEAPGWRIIKAGCDYSHIDDDLAGYPYTLGSVEREAHATIDSLHELIPGLLTRCQKTGAWVPAVQQLTEGGE
jgi:hypothetical protein